MLVHPMKRLSLLRVGVDLLGFPLRLQWWICGIVDELHVRQTKGMLDKGGQLHVNCAATVSFILSSSHKLYIGCCTGSTWSVLLFIFTSCELKGIAIRQKPRRPTLCNPSSSSGSIPPLDSILESPQSIDTQGPKPHIPRQGQDFTCQR